MTTNQELKTITPAFCLNVLRNGTMSHLLKLLGDVIDQPSIVELESYKTYVRILRGMHVSAKKGIWDQTVAAQLETTVEPSFHAYFDVVDACYDTLESIDEETVGILIAHEYRTMLEGSFENLATALTTLDKTGGIWDDK